MQFEAEGTHRRDQERRYLNLQRTGLAIGSGLYVFWIGASFIMSQCYVTGTDQVSHSASN